MNNIFTKYIFFLVLIVGFIMVVESNKVPPIEWAENFSTNEKTPFGLYVLNKEIDQLHPNPKGITRTSKRLYEALSQLIEVDSATNTNLLSITNNNTDYYSITKLELTYAAKGNNLFLLSDFFSHSHLLDSLGIRTYDNESEYYLYNYGYYGLNYYSATLTNPKLTRQRYEIKSPGVSAFFIPDSLRTQVEVLGFDVVRDTMRPNFIKVPHGKGNVYLHANPYAFTNINLLNSNTHLYVEGVLSYMGTRETTFLVDSQSIDTANGERNDTSMLGFIFNNDALRWAWYITLLGVVLFVLFHAKRKQRIIPIIKPLENTTVAFTQTISSLYKNQHDYNSIITKSITYTLERIRRVYFIDTNLLDEEFITNYARKSGKNKQDIQVFVHFVHEIRMNPQLASANNLIRLNNIIEKIV